jgi:hypothetical protein
MLLIYPATQRNSAVTRLLLNNYNDVTCIVLFTLINYLLKMLPPLKKNSPDSTSSETKLLYQLIDIGKCVGCWR